MSGFEALIGEGLRLEGYADYLERFLSAPLAERVSATEAARFYSDIAMELSPLAYEACAREAFERLAPRERQAFVDRLHRGSREGEFHAPLGLQEAEGTEPAELARAAARLHWQEPGLLAEMLGATSAGGLARVLEEPVLRAVLGGVAAMALRRLLPTDVFRQPAVQPAATLESFRVEG